MTKTVSSKRLHQFLEAKKITQKEFLTKVQTVSKNDLKKALEGNQISWAVALAIQKSYPECNPTWIVTGEEEMLLEEKTQTINERIKEIRISMGLSAAEMARKLNKPRSTYSQIENGQMKVTLETVLAIYEMTSLPLEYIMLGECREQVAKLMKLNQEKAELIKKTEAMRKEIDHE
ncbi:MAG TPA: hypothetical protein DIU20_13260 [Cryomorphaceae bacterium]|nr:hypothetical protein [Cryomorphaceae bacterium]|tara:strand:+ start:1371 stop:1898 length:528 start_codon:yes stop_codon:yes gene_type:complete